MKTLRFSMLSASFLAVALGHGAHAQSNFAFCQYGTNEKTYVSQIFPTGAQVINPGDEVAHTFGKYLAGHYAFYNYAGQTYSPEGSVTCGVFPTLSAAQTSRDYWRTDHPGFSHTEFVEAPWSPKITGTATASSSVQKTEADALYDGERRAQQAIPYQNGKTFYVKSWDEHSCEPHSHKTSQYAGAATVTTYSCTVKFTYSEDRNPTASSAIGEGATRDEAIQAAQLNHAGVIWDEPFCSETKKRAAYGSATYKVGESGANSPWYVCTVGYKGTPLQ